MRVLYIAGTATTAEIKVEGQVFPKRITYPSLNLWSELRILTDSLWESRGDGSVSLEVVAEASKADITRYLNDGRDVNILHFSGHGDETEEYKAQVEKEGRDENTAPDAQSGGDSGQEDPAALGENHAGLLLNVDPVAGKFASGAWLKEQLQGKNIDVVLLNCCWSGPIAEEIKDVVGYVVGTNYALKSDDAAKFTKYFYQGLEAGLTLGEILDGIGEKLGTSLYDLSVGNQDYLDKSLLPELAANQEDADEEIGQEIRGVTNELKEIGQKIDELSEEPSETEQIMGVEDQIKQIRRRLPANVVSDVVKVAVGVGVAFAAYTWLNGLEELSKANALSNAEDGEALTEHCKAAANCLREFVTNHYGVGGVLGDFIAFLIGAVDENTWLKFQPYAIMTAFAAPAAGRIVGNGWIIYDWYKDKGVLPLMASRTPDKVAREFATGRIQKIRDWLAEFEK